MDTRPVEINEIDDDDDGAERESVNWNFSLTFRSVAEIFADGNHEVDDVERMDDEDEEDEEIDDDDEEMDESDEVDDDDDDRIDENEESDISSEDEDQLAIHTNGIKKSSQHLGIRESNVDLLGIDGPPTDASYLQTMNDNLHKKFRRQSQHHGILHAASDGFSHGIPHSTDPMQMNGDHENRAFVSNGQALSSAGANHDNQDDDDDIVLVSDDESEDKKSEKRLNRMRLFSAWLLLWSWNLDLPVAESFPSIADVTSIHVDKVTIHSTATAAATTTTTTSLVYDAVYATGHLDNIDRVRYCFLLSTVARWGTRALHVNRKLDHCRVLTMLSLEGTRMTSLYRKQLAIYLAGIKQRIYSSFVFCSVWLTFCFSLVQSSCGGHVIRIETPSVNDSATSLTLAIQVCVDDKKPWCSSSSITSSPSSLCPVPCADRSWIDDHSSFSLSLFSSKETLESLRDAVTLVSDDYTISNDDNGQH